MSQPHDRAGAPPTCPICGKPAVAGACRPFCSARCADVDLGRWFGESYRVPAEPAEDVGRRTTICRVDRRAALGYSRRLRRGLRRAQVAQLVEHATENRSVGGSIPPLGTILKLLNILAIYPSRECLGY